LNLNGVFYPCSYWAEKVRLRSGIVVGANVLCRVNAITWKIVSRFVVGVMRMTARATAYSTVMVVARLRNTVR
jgi:hypothetical protein